MKKLLLALTMLGTITPTVYGISPANRTRIIAAASRNRISEEVCIYNGTDTTVETDNTTIYPGNTSSIATDQRGSCTLKQGRNLYKITCPPITQGKVYLDFTTIQWLAGDSKLLCPRGLDEIAVKNSTYYKIFVLYVLNKMRSVPRPVHAGDETSKVVRNDGNEDKTGSLEIIDGDKQKHIISFPRKSVARGADDGDWTTVTLCANTIKLFNNGFSVTKVR
ncbi:MAG: hypothetical protein NTX86_05755 [Candidatus Dependentiae bacterium]|nr:hypothetical protein [Candidatus Dependentiae bacterium]